MTRQDIIMVAVEQKREDLGMPCWRFAQIHLGISGQHYSMLKSGTKKFNASHLRALFALGIPAETLLGARPEGVRDVQERRQNDAKLVAG